MRPSKLLTRTCHYTRRSAALLSCVVFIGIGACGEPPCVELEQKVCVDLEDKRMCELMQQPERREHLSDAACESIAESLRKRFGRRGKRKQ